MVRVEERDPVLEWRGRRLSPSREIPPPSPSSQGARGRTHLMVHARHASARRLVPLARRGPVFKPGLQPFFRMKWESTDVGQCLLYLIRALPPMSPRQLWPKAPRHPVPPISYFSRPFVTFVIQTPCPLSTLPRPSRSRPLLVPLVAANLLWYTVRAESATS